MNKRIKNKSGGWTLIELVITMTVLAILSVGVIPLVKTAVKRQREYELRAALRQMREAIKEFHRDAVPSPYLDAPTAATTGTAPPASPPDPRSKVAIADKTLFGVDNVERYPPSLDTLVQGASVAPRVVAAAPDINKNATDNPILANKKKIYLRKVPIDPMTGKDDWCLHSPYDDPGTCSDTADAGIFDVTSKSDGTALDGTKYKDW